ncbi:MAG: electron transfer flavoprotein subunit beta/FixA family protein [Dehalococcoidia bacterium]|nr:electron transfer flavoprotein subunit beta/FixA family protein [Dehalococcoidia bacterium]
MNIVVCVKQVPDPETPPSSFKIDSVANRVMPAAGVPPVISPFDEHAVEAALRIKDAKGAKVTVISMGKDLVMDVVKKPLSMGADELILLQDEAFEGGDSFTTAYALSMAIKKTGQYDLILCGRQAADWDVGQVGLGIAELLGIPSVAPVKKVEALDGRVKVERVVPDGYEVIEVPMPAVVTISNELGEPRYATMKGIMAAARKKPTVWTSQDIGAEASKIGKAGSRIKLLKLFIPVREVKCVMAEGESIEEAAADLALKMRAAKII